MPGPKTSLINIAGKRGLFGLLIIFGCLVTCACVPEEQRVASFQPPAPKGKEFYSQLPFVKVRFPDSYQVRTIRSDKGLLLIIAGTTLSAPSVVIEIRPLTQPLNMDMLAEALVRVEKQKLSQKGALTNAKPALRTTLAGQPAIYFRFVNQGQSYLHYLAVTQKYLYAVTVKQDAPGVAQSLAEFAIKPAINPRTGAEAGSSAGQVSEQASRAVWTLDPRVYPGVLSQLRQAVRANPEDPFLAALLVEAAAWHWQAADMQGGLPPKLNTQELLLLARKAVRQAPQSADAHRALGLALTLSGKPADAEISLKHAVSLQKNDIRNYLAYVIWYGLDAKAREGVARQALALRSDSVAAQLSLAQALYDQKNPSQAVLQFEKALRAQPENTTALSGMARIEMDNPQTQGKAQKRLIRVLELDPQAVGVRFNLAILYRRYRNPILAEEQLRDLLRLTPNDGSALNLLGLCLRDQQKYSAAAQAFRAAIKASPKGTKAYFNLGALCAQSLNDLGCARQAFRQFLQLEPQGRRADHVRSWLANHGG